MRAPIALLVAIVVTGCSSSREDLRAVTHQYLSALVAGDSAVARALVADTAALAQTTMIDNTAPGLLAEAVETLEMTRRGRIIGDSAYQFFRVERRTEQPTELFVVFRRSGERWRITGVHLPELITDVPPD